MGVVAAGHGLVGESLPMRAVLRDVALVAPTRTTVLVLGETGTGKERIAQAIHQGSPRRGASFVAVNCAAISETLLESALFGHEKGAFSGAHCRREGLFKIADGGTLFLDEIGETSPALQAKLLRVLQERQFERVGGTTPVSSDVRVIAATNRDLRQMVAERSFRSDLFYRLNVMVINVPALRHRREDIVPLVSHILGRLSFELGIPRPLLGPEVLARLEEYAWPGNVRELENVLERLLVVSQDRTIGLCDLPAEVRDAATRAPFAADGASFVPDGRPLIPGASFREIERHAILATYEACGQSPSRTAHVLGLSPRTVHYRLREYRGESGRRAPRMAGWRGGRRRRGPSDGARSPSGSPPKPGWRARGDTSDEAQDARARLPVARAAPVRWRARQAGGRGRDLVSGRARGRRARLSEPGARHRRARGAAGVARAHGRRARRADVGDLARRRRARDRRGRRAARGAAVDAVVVGARRRGSGRRRAARRRPALAARRSPRARRGRALGAGRRHGHRRRVRGGRLAR